MEFMRSCSTPTILIGVSAASSENASIAANLAIATASSTGPELYRIALASMRKCRESRVILADVLVLGFDDAHVTT